MGRKIPSHVAIILDGNRRWAKAHGLPASKGHERGLEKIKEAMLWCIEAGVKELTLYCFSTENFKRGKDEIDFLFRMFQKKISGFSKDPVIREHGVKISVIGKISMFPRELQKEMLRIMEETRANGGFKLNLAMAYGARMEIADALGILKEKAANPVAEEDVSQSLSVPDDVDLLIRPGGEKRLSNFLLWQSAYAELMFLDAMWPEFSKEDFFGCLEEFSRRERRFGE
ncbi:di-trans,poly-cis-decaprenylcistransferase [Candidatus Woesearchaeota archaeon]|nr:di-trans,poly-cis-decaprenylcistransferase [Candidatus Woesearchaeota archaeon]